MGTYSGWAHKVDYVPRNIIDHDPGRYSAEKLKGMLMAGQPMFHGL